MKVRKKPGKSRAGLLLVFESLVFFDCFHKRVFNAFGVSADSCCVVSTNQKSNDEGEDDEERSHF